MILTPIFEVPNVASIKVTITLPPVLFDELSHACREAGITTRQFIAESTEVVLASRRLEKLPPTTLHASYTSPRLPEFKEG